MPDLIHSYWRAITGLARSDDHAEFVEDTPGARERTEVDKKLGSVLFEAKLTEGDFQTQNASTVEQYRDLRQVFDSSQLPRRGPDYFSYQLLRNVLAAYALNLQFCVLLDARRPDLLEQWYRIMRCVLSTDLRTNARFSRGKNLHAACRRLSNVFWMSSMESPL